MQRARDIRGYQVEASRPCKISKGSAMKRTSQTMVSANGSDSAHIGTVGTHDPLLAAVEIRIGDEFLDG